MKKLILTVLLAVTGICAFSQIPNSGFENWTSMGSYSNPDSWGTMNNTTASTSVFTATKGTPGSPGVSFLKLTSLNAGGHIVNGIAVSGVLDTINLVPISGFPFSAQPDSFTGKWQHMIFGTSQGFISVNLTKWNSISQQRETVASATQYLSGMAMTWAKFSIHFVYMSSDIPDTCIIFMQASGSNPSANDYLWLDNLAFSGSVAGISENNEQPFSVKSFPNPADKEMEFTLSQALSKGDRLIICDMAGNIVYNEAVNESKLKINTADLSNGTYICKLVNSFNVQYATEKIAIQH